MKMDPYFADLHPSVQVTLIIVAGACIVTLLMTLGGYFDKD